MGSLLDYSKIFCRTKEIKLHISHTILGASEVFTKPGFPPTTSSIHVCSNQLQDPDFESVLKHESLGFTIPKVFHHVIDCTFLIYYNLLNEANHSLPHQYSLHKVQFIYMLIF